MKLLPGVCFQYKVNLACGCTGAALNLVKLPESSFHAQPPYPLGAQNCQFFVAGSRPGLFFLLSWFQMLLLNVLPRFKGSGSHGFGGWQHSCPQIAHPGPYRNGLNNRRSWFHVLNTAISSYTLSVYIYIILVKNGIDTCLG